MKFPFSNTLEGRAAGGSPIPAAFLEEHPKQQIKLTVEITSQQWTSKRIFQGSYIKCYFYVTPYPYLTIKTLLCQEVIDKIFKICYLRVTIRNIPSSCCSVPVQEPFRTFPQYTTIAASGHQRFPQKYYQPPPVLAMNVP